MKTLLALALLAAGCAAAEGDPKTTTPVGGGPLVLELFTSQGCSSCPPADKLVSELAATKGGRVLAPLSFHVDYWNGLGWADPYSSAAWTQRQHGYAYALGDKSVYTPELVVGGAAGMVGSWRDRITTAIAAAPRVDLLAATATWKLDAVEVAATAPAGTEVWVAVWGRHDEHRDPARRERRHHDGQRSRGAPVRARRGGRAARDGARPARSGVARCGAVAFAQPKGGGRIVASALLPMAR